MERRVRQVYTPPVDEEVIDDALEEESNCTRFGDEHIFVDGVCECGEEERWVADEEEHVCEFDDFGVCFCGAWSPFHEPPEKRMPLVEKLADLGIDVEELKNFCRTATIVPKELPPDPWDSYETVHSSAQTFVQELKRCNAKTYHIRQALEGAIRTLEDNEDDERRAAYESASEEAKSQQSAIAGSDVEKEEAKEEEA